MGVYEKEAIVFSMAKLNNYLYYVYTFCFRFFMSPLYVQCQRRREKMLGSEYCWKFGDSKCRVPGDHGSIGEGRYLPAVEVTVNFDQ